MRRALLAAFLIPPPAAAFGQCRADAPCGEPEPVCAAAPMDPKCVALPDEKIIAIFENAAKAMGVDPAPRTVVNQSVEFVRFDCTKQQAVPGPANAETRQCEFLPGVLGYPVFAVGGSLVNMSLPCPELKLEREDVVDFWAKHELSHAKNRDFACYLSEIETVCRAWAATPDYQKAAKPLLRRAKKGAKSIAELSPAEFKVFRNSLLDACLGANSGKLDASKVEREKRADTDADAKAKPGAMECAMKGAAVYFDARRLRTDSTHEDLSTRILNAEERRARRWDAVRDRLEQTPADKAFGD